MFQRSGQYWAFAHFSRNVIRGAKRFGSTCQMEGVEQVAFENPDGQKVLIVTNSGLARTATLKQGNDAADVNLAADSLRLVVELIRQKGLAASGRDRFPGKNYIVFAPEPAS